MEPFIGQIMMVGFNFAPRGWALCDGQLLQISQNQALFSLLGTTYGGDGRTTFGLPDLRGRVPMHAGTGPGLTPRQLGHKGGTETVTLSEAQLPPHDHPATTTSLINTTGEEGTSASPDNLLIAKSGSGDPDFTNGAPDSQLHPNSIHATTAVFDAGGGQAHPIVQPFLAVNFVIALQGIFPSRN